MALAVAAFHAPAPAEAAPQQRIIDITYCWSLTTFGPNGCHSGWPTEPVTLIGGNSGAAVLGFGTTDAVTGTFQFSNQKNNLVLSFANPDANTVSVTYSGARYQGGGPKCYRGPNVADFVTDPDLTGVWFGCLR
jgi:hypothetical protein